MKENIEKYLKCATIILKIVKHEFMLNFYLKDKPAHILYLYFINYTRKNHTYLQF